MDRGEVESVGTSSQSRIPEKQVSPGGDSKRSTAAQRISFDRRLIPPVFGLMVLTGVALWTMWQGYIEPAEPPLAPMPRWWVSPIEFSSKLRLPVIEGALNCVHSTPDGRKVWIVGDGGLILHSSDGGRTWVRQGENVSTEPEPPPPSAPDPAPAPRPAEEKKAEPDPKKAAAAAGRSRPQVFAQIPPEKQETLPAEDKVPGAAKASIDTAQNAAQQNQAARPNPAIQQNLPGKEARPAVQEQADTKRPLRYRNWLGVGFDDEGVNGFAACYSEAVIRTKDGGKTWEKGQPLTYESQKGGIIDHPMLFGVQPDHPGHFYIWGDYSNLITKDLGLTFEPDFSSTNPPAPPPISHPMDSDRDVDVGILLNQEQRSFRRRIESHRVIDQTGKRKEIDIIVQNSPARGRWYVGTDGRLSWEPIEGKVTNLRVRLDGHGKIYSLWVSPEKSNAPLWLCGADGLLMRSTDGGVTWNERSRPKPPEESIPPTWFTLPPPLFYPAAIALFIWMLSIQLTRPPVEPAATTDVEAKDPKTGERFPKGFEPDKPVESEKDDTLNFKEISEGLSRFLRNQDTKPPLSIAITGEWGSGKSSIMGMLKQKLIEHDCPVVWFNAWHHQKEASLLAALLQNLNLQAIWPWYTMKGIRLRLELIRRKLVPTIWIPAVLVACLFFGWVWAKPNCSLLFWKDISDLASGTSKDSGDAAGKFVSLLLSLLGLGGVGATGRWLWNAAKGLGVDPAKLVQDAQSSSLATSRDQISFRYQFAKDFARLTGILRDAFQTRITVFIDDLDRCEPTQVREILEAVNFLVSSGDCFIVMGMEYQRVKDCVGQGFRDSVVGADGLNDKDPAERERARAELNKFAQRYMEKLVNIVVPVPQSEDDNLKDLVAKEDKNSSKGAGNQPVAPAVVASGNRTDTTKGTPAKNLNNTNQAGNTKSGSGNGTGDGVPVAVAERNRLRRKILTALAIVAAGILCYWGGHNLGASFTDPKPTGPRAPIGETIRIKLWNKTLIVRSVDHLWTVEFEPPQSVPVAPPMLTRPLDEEAFQPEATKATTSGLTLQSLWASLLAALVPLAIASGWFIMSKALSKEWVEKDKKEFTDSMRVWYPVYSIRRDDSKASSQNATPFSQRATPRSIKRFANRARYYAMRARRGVVSNHPEVDDAKLVALAAIDDYFAGISRIPDYRWDADELWAVVSNPKYYSSHSTTAAPGEMDLVWDTIQKHKLAFSDTWPPTSDEVKFIRGLAQGIHLT